MEMMRRARHLIPDKASADRLVEGALLRAIEETGQGRMEGDVHFWQQDDFQPCSPALTSQRRRDLPAATSTSQPRRAPAPPDPETSCAAAQPEVKLTL